MRITDIQWSSTCCAWDGKYAEVQTKDGGMARVKEYDGKYLVMRFSKNNVCVDVDSSGNPEYKKLSAPSLEKLIGGVV